MLASQPELHIVVNGVLDSTSSVRWLHLWRSPAELENIRSVFARIDESLESLSSGYDAVEFLDETAWFRRVFGDRDEQGVPVNHQVTLGGTTSITNTRGNHPANRSLEDHHSGTVQNGLWTDLLIRATNRAFGTAIPPLLDAELADLVDPNGEYGIAPPRRPPVDPRYEQVVTEREEPKTVPQGQERGA